MDNTEKKSIRAWVVILLVLLSVFIIRQIRDKLLIAEYCELPNYTDIRTESVHDCVELLIETGARRDKLAGKIDNDYFPYPPRVERINRMLTDELELRYSQLLYKIIENYNGSFDYSVEKIYSTFNENYYKIKYISRDCKNENFSSAFGSYLDISDVYVNDCTYYLLSETYPEIFSIGIRDRLLEAGEWSSLGKDMLDATVKYIDSMPNGRQDYVADIQAVQKQLRAKTTKTKSWNSNKQSTTNVPYYGMEESRISFTGLGSYNKKELCLDYYALRPERRSVTYYWYDNSGKTMFKARAYAGKVISTADFRGDKLVTDSASNH